MKMEMKNAQLIEVKGIYAETTKKSIPILKPVRKQIEENEKANEKQLIAVQQPPDPKQAYSPPGLYPGNQPDSPHP